MSVQRFSKATYLGYNSRYTTAWSPQATGGTSSILGGYVIHTFTATGSNTFTVIRNLSSVEYLLVAGGGSGNDGFINDPNVKGGGGGAGGLVTGNAAVGPGSLPMNVGAGGVYTFLENAAPSGANSTGFGATAVGGGGGGKQSRNGAAGGSGGGGGSNAVGGAGTAGQGNAGGNGISLYTAGGGGGGAGSAGSAPAKGSGLSNSISGGPVTYAEGGVGASSGSGVGSAGAANSGDGGNGGENQQVGGNGGSGIVIIRYAVV